MVCKAFVSLGVVLCIDRAFAQPQFTAVVDGVEHSFDNDQPSVNLNGVSDFCATGVWIAHASENYLKANRIIPYSGGVCYKNTPLDSIRSLCFVGLHHNTSAPSVTLFSDRSFNGAAVTFVNEIPSITFPVKSLVTIGTTVQLFEEENFQGSSTCLDIDPYFCRIGVCWGEILNDYDESDWDINSAKSARTGCKRSTVLTEDYPENGDARIPF